MANEPEWRRLNRANWDEAAAVHMGPGSTYDFADLRAGRKRLWLADDELGAIAGQRILHLQCHIGVDSLALAQRGAEIVGLDFSAPAIAAATGLAAQLGLSARARFVQADLYDAAAAIPEPASFDRVFVTWGTTIWLPDIEGWARLVAHFLKPGGIFYFADVHPVAFVFDDEVAGSGGNPGFWAAYFGDSPVVVTNPRDYADPNARLENATTHQFLHPVGDVVTALIEAGLRLDWLHEHDGLPWRMFACQMEDANGIFRWPEKSWLPLSYSLQATRPAA
jgi:SAM-dependent methyltransferase